MIGVALLAAVLATVVLRVRSRVYRRMAEEEQRDTDHDGIPEFYQQHEPGQGSAR